MNNHTRSTSSGEGRLKRLDLTGKKPRRWQPYQAYSRLYYTTKLRPIIAAGYLEYLIALPAGEEPDSQFKYRNRQLRLMLEEETDEVKAEVAELCEKTVSMREEAEVEEMLNENITKDEARSALRKK
jgi:hypothetical protein